MKRILIVGGVAGGASAAARARRLSEEAEIVMFERGEFVSFANCGLPYHIGGDIPNRDALLLQTPQSFKRRFNVDVRVFHDVIEIDKAGKSLLVRNLLTGEERREAYDVLLLSPGAAPIRPPFPGIDSPGVHTLRNIPDMDRILAALAHDQPRHVTVVGGGFIGLEMMEALHQRKLDVTLLELSDQVMAPVDKEMANMLHARIREEGIDLRLRTGLSAIESLDVLAEKTAAVATEQRGGLRLTLSDGTRLDTGLLILAIGVKPETLLAAKAGLELGPRGGIKVDAAMRTSDPFIYAVGDAVEETDFVTGESVLIPLAGPANRQGRIAADNMLGRAETYKKTQGTAICKLFDLAVASTGLSEKRLLQLGLPFEKAYVHPGSHAGYYPGAHPVSLKLLFAPDGKIYGAQAIGKDGVDKRIDVLAVAQRAGLTVFDLQDLELTYAPPFGSAKDVINMAGFVASNHLKGDTLLCYAAEVEARHPHQQVLDVRNGPELDKLGRIPGAMHIPLDELRNRLHELPRDKELLISCQVGLRGHVACRLLSQHGFKVKNLSGGFKTWQMAVME
ncbi:FAD-dependent oxidoreductase [Aeromonas dhakensis]|uniref:FAD-dependent oxidoreductase n=1 Tax=Aeromonas dhakensis TaxID=196024 RepID=UPI00191F0DDC|nr:FAD-dependent oxidoreductase [Aeromonas dhakensis]MBL0674100.1 FAD-dependent oxidoreductase [Aeromonas dhakensis]MDX7742636.1 FAD-dependent oxidoreductase [Aeromonas dhakensis]WAG00317.1 FAD-dependent oxidoreductase [Aeromonas dhakensis]